MNPGDLSWGEMADLADRMVIYDRTPQESVVERAKNADIVIVNKVKLDTYELDNLPLLKYVGVLATGYNVVNCEYAKKKGIVVTNIPAYSTDSVAQTVTGLLIELATGIGAYDRSVHNGDWSRCKDFTYQLKPGVELNGKTIGIVGMGRIGTQVAKIARAFGMNVLAYNKDRTGEGEFFKYVPFWELIRNSDVVSLHCPQTKDTVGMINDKVLSAMKPSAFLINASRGGLVDEAALAAALNGGKIAGAGLDVLSEEPPSPSNPLLTAKNCIITPHIAWTTVDARKRLMDIAVANLKAFLSGKSQNVVNK